MLCRRFGVSGRFTKHNERVIVVIKYQIMNYNCCNIFENSTYLSRRCPYFTSTRLPQNESFKNK